jgi:hypothetical protein
MSATIDATTTTIITTTLIHDGDGDHTKGTFFLLLVTIGMKESSSPRLAALFGLLHLGRLVWW